MMTGPTRQLVGAIGMLLFLALAVVLLSEVLRCP
ncbi:hypothetical protein MTsN3n11_14390 [Qipengyuania sp. MTN3-11]